MTELIDGVKTGAGDGLKLSTGKKGKNGISLAPLEPSKIGLRRTAGGAFVRRTDDFPKLVLGSNFLGLNFGLEIGFVTLLPPSKNGKNKTSLSEG